MNDALKLQISAFVDGELPDNEAELLLRRLSQDAELRGQVARYLTIGRAIRGELELTAVSKLRGRIAAALGEEVAEAEPVQELVPTKFMRPVAGVAVAASVTVMALLGLRQMGPFDEIADPGVSDLAALAIDDAPSYTEPPADEFMSDRPSDMLTRYYLHHGSRTADLGNSGILTRLVGLELREGELVPVDEPDEAPAESPSPASESVSSGQEQ